MRKYRKLSGSLAASLCLGLSLLSTTLQARDFDTEFFELGVTTGVINIQDFSSELSLGFNTTFKASEDFFLQFNYSRVEASNSSVEDGPQGPFSGSRTYQHYNLLLGLNIFQGEVFRKQRSGFSSLYAVAGIGDTEFLDEANFTYVLGMGYEMALSRRINLRFDYRNYFYESSIIDQEENTTLNSHIQLGLGWLF